LSWGLPFRDEIIQAILFQDEEPVFEFFLEAEALIKPRAPGIGQVHFELDKFGAAHLAAPCGFAQQGLADIAIAGRGIDKGSTT
jgi:hypothetical protein